jgi:hypothetical protein
MTEFSARWVIGFAILMATIISSVAVIPILNAAISPMVDAIPAQDNLGKLIGMLIIPVTLLAILARIIWKAFMQKEKKPEYYVGGE